MKRFSNDRLRLTEELRKKINLKTKGYERWRREETRYFFNWDANLQINKL